MLVTVESTKSLGGGFYRVHEYGRRYNIYAMKGREWHFSAAGIARSLFRLSAYFLVYILYTSMEAYSRDVEWRKTGEKAFPLFSMGFDKVRYTSDSFTRCFLQNFSN